MCMGGGSNNNTPATFTPLPPPPAPPPPAPTAQGLTVGANRNDGSLQSFLQNAITANKSRGTAALRTDMGGLSGGIGLNVPS